MLSRVSLAPTDWHGETVPAGTQFLILNPTRTATASACAYADRFAPEEWTEGDAGSYPGFNHFSRGPQGCPGTAISMLVARTAVGTVLERGIESALARPEPGASRSPT